jgi:23S rRNA pseudouridine2605 synthase
MQLNKMLALSGAASRRKAVDLIESGRVRVNGFVVLKPGTRIDAENDVVMLGRRRLQIRRHFRYVLMNKPAGVVTTVSDERGRACVMDLIPEGKGMFPVGRLDMDTEGVLLLTDDGDLAYRLTHPRFGVEKLYQAWVKGTVEERSVKRLEKGVLIEEGVRASGRVRVVKKEGGGTLVWIEIHEGRKRQIRNMLEAVGHPVIRLERIRFAGMTADGVRKGSWRSLGPGEVRRLYRAAGLDGQEKLKVSSSKLHEHRSGPRDENRSQMSD